MKLYLSSYKIGNEGQKLAEMIGGEKRIGVISNSRDYSTELDRRKAGDTSEMESLKALGLDPFLLDLRDYFGKKDELEKLIEQTNAVWILGGNSFVLRVAMNKSGFDEIVKRKVSDKNFVYAGYSAGGCVLTADMDVYSMTDDPNEVQNAYPGEKVINEGLGIIDFVFEPHYKSDHEESDATDKEIDRLIDEKIHFKAFRDGEVYISEVIK